MGTNYIAPTWRMPRNANNTPVNKLSNYSIECDGTNDYITVNDNIFSGLETWSMAGFYNLSTLTVDSALFGKYGNAPQQIMLYWDNPLGWRLLWKGSPTGDFVQLPSIVANEWHFIAVTYDGTTAKMYLDDQVYTYTASTGAIVTDTGSWQIGADGNAGKDFNGKLSQLSFYDYALTDGTDGTEDQINYLYNLNNPMAITGAKPIAYYPLGDNSNPVATAGYPNISVGADSVFDFESGSTTFIKAFDVPVTTFTECTFSAWVNFETVTGTYQYVMGMGSAGPGNFMSISKNNNSGTWYTYNGTGSDYTASTPVANRWYHVVVTQTGTTRRFYINGIEDANSPFTVNALAIPYNNLTLGAYNNSSSATPSVSYKLDGQLSNVQVWDKKIEQADVTTLYNNGVPLFSGTQPEEANLRGWYKLNQSANWEADTVGNWQIPDAVSAYPQSFHFDGTADYIDIAASTDLVFGTGDFSISFWLKTTDVDFNILNPLTATGAGYWGLLVQSSKLRWNDEYNVSNLWEINNTALVDGNWHNVVLTRDSGTTLVWYDGIPQTLSVSADSNDYSGSGGLRIGDGNLDELLGNLSNLALWKNLALDEDQALTIYNNGSPLTTAIQSANLKAWYKLDGSSKSVYNSTADYWTIEQAEITPTYTEGLFIGGDYIGGSPFVSYAGMRLTNQAISSNHVTYSFWYKRVLPTTGSSTAIVKCSGYLGGVNVTSGGVVQWIGDGATEYINFAGNVIDGGWHHIMIYYPNTSSFSSDDVRGFIDGVETTKSHPPVPFTATSGPVTTIQGTLIQSVPINVELSNWSYFLTDETSNINTIYNGGTPGDIISLNPSVWLKYDSATTAFNGATGSEYGVATDSSGNSNDGLLAGKTDGSTTKLVTSNVQSGSGVSSGMTEQNLVNNNVSTLNGESSGMDTTNLVQSNLTKKQPFSSSSVEFDGLNYFGLAPFSEFELQTISYSVWFKRTGALTSRVCVVSQGSSSNKGWTCWLDGTTIRGQFGAGNNNSYNNNTVTSYKTYIPDNTWGNITATCDGTDQKIYVNGILRNTYTDVATIDYSSVVGFRIGERVTGSSNFYGEISNPAVWDQVLTDDDVLNIYNNGVPQDLSDFRIAPLAWWELGGKYTYWNGTDLVARSTSSGDFDVTGTNTAQSQIVGTAPGSEASGTGTNLDLSDLIGDMKDSKLNAYSINMADYADGVTNPADSGRSTNVP